MQAQEQNKIELRLSVEWDDDDKIYVGRCPDLMYGGVHGKGRTEVLRELLQVVGEWVEIFEKDGTPFPKSSFQESRNRK